MWPVYTILNLAVDHYGTLFAAPLVCSELLVFRSRNLVFHCTWILQTKLRHTPEHTNGAAKKIVQTNVVM